MQEHTDQGYLEAQSPWKGRNMQKTNQSRTIGAQADRTFTTQAESDHPLTLQMVTLMLPLIMGNILQQLYNTIDAAVIGHFAGQQDFAAVGVAGTVMNLFLFAIAGACTGISILFAQLYGAGRIDRLRQEHFIALSTGLVFSVILACTGLLANRPLLRLLQTPEELLPCTSTDCLPAIPVSIRADPVHKGLHSPRYIDALFVIQSGVTRRIGTVQKIEEKAPSFTDHYIPSPIVPD